MPDQTPPDPTQPGQTQPDQPLLNSVVTHAQPVTPPDTPREPVPPEENHAAAGGGEALDVLPSDEPVPRVVRLPGPGLPESLLWAGSIIVLQLLLTIPIWIVVALCYGAEMGDLEGISPNGRMLLFGLPTLLGFVVLVPLVLLRLGARPGAVLNLSWPSLTQLAIVCSVVLPLSIVADTLYALADAQWQALAREVGMLELLNEASITDALQSQTKGASMLLMLLFIAVVPALGEEVVFRGLIGRGLVARWGVVAGVLLTSVLFAMVHMYPPHVVAILPVGLVIHLVYLATRSFWAPVLFHFLNNATAVALLASGTPAESDPQPLLVAGAIVYVLIALGLLWRFRTQYRTAEGGAFRPPYVTVAEPVPESGYRRTGRQSAVATVVFGLLLAVQVGLLAAGN